MDLPQLVVSLEDLRLDSFFATFCVPCVWVCHSCAVCNYPHPETLSLVLIIYVHFPFLFLELPHRIHEHFGRVVRAHWNMHGFSVSCPFSRFAGKVQSFVAWQLPSRLQAILYNEVGFVALFKLERFPGRAGSC